jgi:hypothetical protein
MRRAAGCDILSTGSAKMKIKQSLFTLILLIISTGFTSAAGGGGGMSFGYQTLTYPFLERYPVVNNSLELIYYGGFGYGVSSNRTITGGFGFAIMDVAGESEIAGGFGGFLTGYRLLDRPVNISFMSWTGLGGISTGVLPVGEYEGFFALLQEVTVEIGIPLVRWFMPTVFAGYQIAGNLIPGAPFITFFTYTPVIGFRLQWGSFF